jgi:hypothetical protein
MSIEHCSFAGQDGRYGSDFDPGLAAEIAAAGIYMPDDERARTVDA